MYQVGFYNIKVVWNCKCENFCRQNLHLPLFFPLFFPLLYSLLFNVNKKKASIFTYYIIIKGRGPGRHISKPLAFQAFAIQTFLLIKKRREPCRIMKYSWRVIFQLTVFLKISKHAQLVNAKPTNHVATAISKYYYIYFSLFKYFFKPPSLGLICTVAF